MVGVPAAVSAALGSGDRRPGRASRAGWRGVRRSPGDPAELDLAAAAAGLTDEQALAALEELVARDVLRATTVPRRYAFRHPIVRRAVYEAAGEAWRLGAHARAARRSRRGRARSRARAHHVERSARVGDEAAAAVLEQAARQAAARAPAVAARWLTAALRLLPDRPEQDAARRLGMLVALASAQAATGRLAEALDTLLQSARADPAGACRAAGTAGRRLRVVRERRLGATAPPTRGCCTRSPSFPTTAAPAGRRCRSSSPPTRSMTATSPRCSSGPSARRRPRGRSATPACWRWPRRSCASPSTAWAARSRPMRPAARAPPGSMRSPTSCSPPASTCRTTSGFAEYFCEALRRRGAALPARHRGLARAVGQGQFVVPMMVGLAQALERLGSLREALATAEAAVEAGRLTGNRAGRRVRAGRGGLDGRGTG